MSNRKDPDEKVVVWENTGDRGRHVYDDVGGTVMPKGGTVVYSGVEREIRNKKPEGVTERVMTRREAYKKYGKLPVND